MTFAAFGWLHFVCCVIFGVCLLLTWLPFVCFGVWLLLVAFMFVFRMDP